MTNPILIATDLCAVRGERVLFRHISLQAGPGDLILLRGRNGAGKTTLLRQLAGLSEPAQGQIERHQRHHWLGHSNGLKAHETPRSHLQHWTNVWGGSANIGAVLAEVDMTQPADVPCRMLSAGQKRRTALGRLRLAERPLWLLDEPFSALDTDGAAMLVEMLEAHRAAGGAVIAALHGPAPIEANAEVVI